MLTVRNLYFVKNLIFCPIFIVKDPFTYISVNQLILTQFFHVQHWSYTLHSTFLPQFENMLDFKMPKILNKPAGLKSQAIYLLNASGFHCMLVKHKRHLPFSASAKLMLLLLVREKHLILASILYLLCTDTFYQVAKIVKFSAWPVYAHKKRLALMMLAFTERAMTSSATNMDVYRI